MAHFIFLPSKAGDATFLVWPLQLQQFSLPLYFTLKHIIKQKWQIIQFLKQKKWCWQRLTFTWWADDWKRDGYRGLCSPPISTSYEVQPVYSFHTNDPLRSQRDWREVRCGPILIQSRFRTMSSIIALGHSAGKRSNHGRRHRFDLTSLSAFTQVNRTWNYGDA